jgi:predicted phage terminase large subunit-like protein
MSDVILEQLLAISQEEVAGWPEKQQAWYAETLERRLILRDPATFAAHHSGGEWEAYNHLKVTAQAVVEMVEDDLYDLTIIDQPVRHGKSELCSKWTPAWFLSKFPTKRVLLSSYEADFASTWGRKVRNIIEEIGAEYDIKLDPTSKAANRWDLDNGKGAMGTAGVGGAITGKGGHLLIVDDPIKNKEEAESQVMRDKAWEWWQSVWLTRREPGAKLLVIMSRWHEDDLIGRLVKRAEETGLRVNRVRMPAIAEEEDTLGRQPGEALCPERYDEKALAGIREDVGPATWASLFQQRPVTLGGGMLKPSEWLKKYHRSQIGSDAYYQFGATLVGTDTCSTFSTMDVAYTNTQRSDYTVIGTFAVAMGEVPMLLVLNIDRRRTTHAAHVPMVRDCWNTYKPSWIGIEKGAANLSMFDEVAREGIVVKWLKPDKNKVARAETLSALMESGRVWIPENAPWIADMIDELASFPAGAHDDIVDVMAYAAQQMMSRQVHPGKQHSPHRSYDERMWEKVKKMQKQQKRDRKIEFDGWM